MPADVLVVEGAASWPAEAKDLAEIEETEVGQAFDTDLMVGKLTIRLNIFSLLLDGIIKFSLNERRDARKTCLQTVDLEYSRQTKHKLLIKTNSYLIWEGKERE